MSDATATVTTSTIKVLLSIETLILTNIVIKVVVVVVIFVIVAVYFVIIFTMLFKTDLHTIPQSSSHTEDDYNYYFCCCCFRRSQLKTPSRKSVTRAFSLPVKGASAPVVSAGCVLQVS